MSNKKLKGITIINSEGSEEWIDPERLPELDILSEEIDGIKVDFDFSYDKEENVLFIASCKKDNIDYGIKVIIATEEFIQILYKQNNDNDMLDNHEYIKELKQKMLQAFKIKLEGE